MNVASLVSDLLPDPPYPMSSAHPLGILMILCSLMRCCSASSKSTMFLSGANLSCSLHFTLLSSLYLSRAAVASILTSLYGLSSSSNILAGLSVMMDSSCCLICLQIGSPWMSSS